MSGGTQDYWGNKILNILGGNTLGALANVYLGLFITLPGKNGSGGVECSAGNYARVAIPCNSTNFPAASGQLISLATAQTFLTANADWAPALTPIVGWGLFDASSSGNCLYCAHLTTSYLDATAASATDAFTAPSSAFINGQTVVLQAVPGSSLPGAFAVATTYYVVSAIGSTFKLSLTSGGAAVHVTSDGACLVGVVATQAILSGQTAYFGPNTISIQGS